MNNYITMILMIANKFLRNRVGIYGIRNVINNKIYVGKTKCMYKRCHQYIYDFRERSIGHINDYLFNSISKYGINNFEFFPLEFCGLNETSERELFWIEKLKSTNRTYGYNLRVDSSTGMLVSKETSIKITNNLRKQWSSGIRDQHSTKLKDNWKNNQQRKVKQASLFRKIKTKYSYKVIHPCGKQETCFYKRIVDLGLKSVLSNFHRSKSDYAEIKGFKITRVIYETI